MKSVLRTAGVALVTGSLTVSMAWAGTVIAPVGGVQPTQVADTLASQVAATSPDLADGLGTTAELASVANLGA